MDLGFSLLARSRRSIVRPVGLGALIADAMARQAASPTARVQARLAPPVPAPCSFDAGVAAILSGRRIPVAAAPHPSPLMTSAFTEPL